MSGNSRGPRDARSPACAALGNPGRLRSAVGRSYQSRPAPLGRHQISNTRFVGRHAPPRLTRDRKRTAISASRYPTPNHGDSEGLNGRGSMKARNSSRQPRRKRSCSKRLHGSWLLVLLLAAASASASPRPNVILIMADDLGWAPEARHIHSLGREPQGKDDK